MRRDSQPSIPLTEVALGDIVVMPDGQHVTVRSRVPLPQNVGTMASFCIAGEMDVLLSTPANAAAPVGVYLPAEMAPNVQNYSIAAEGAASYYAPHLPALRGAMGEILFRLIEVQGAVDPVVLVYRGQELIVFMRAAFAPADSFTVQRMRRDSRNDVDQVRHAARLASPGAPAPQGEIKGSRSLFGRG